MRFNKVISIFTSIGALLTNTDKRAKLKNDIMKPNENVDFFNFKVRTPEELIKDRSSAYDYLA